MQVGQYFYTFMDGYVDQYHRILYGGSVCQYLHIFGGYVDHYQRMCLVGYVGQSLHTSIVRMWVNTFQGVV